MFYFSTHHRFRKQPAGAAEDRRLSDFEGARVGAGQGDGEEHGRVQGGGEDEGKGRRLASVHEGADMLGGRDNSFQLSERQVFRHRPQNNRELFVFYN